MRPAGGGIRTGAVHELSTVTARPVLAAMVSVRDPESTAVVMLDTTSVKASVDDVPPWDETTMLASHSTSTPVDSNLRDRILRTRARDELGCPGGTIWHAKSYRRLVSVTEVTSILSASSELEV